MVERVEVQKKKPNWKKVAMVAGITAGLTGVYLAGMYTVGFTVDDLHRRGFIRFFDGTRELTAAEAEKYCRAM